MSWTEESKLLQEKKELIAKARELCNSETRAAEDEAKIQAMFADVDKIDARLESMEKVKALETAYQNVTRKEVDTRNRTEGDNKEAFRSAYNNWVKAHASEDYAVVAQAAAKLEQVRAVSSVGVGSNPAASLSLPETIHNEFFRVLKDFNGIRRAGITVVATANGADYRLPILDDTGVTGAIVAEHSASADDDTNDPTTSEKVLKAYNFDSHIVRVSNQYLADQAFDVEQWLLSAALFDRCLALANDKYTKGVGTTEPEGVVTGASAGVAAANASSATAVTLTEIDKLIDSLDYAYHLGSVAPKFMMHQLTWGKIRSMVDGEDRPLFNLGDVSLNVPYRLRGFEVVINNSMDTMAASKKSILFGNFSKFVAREVYPPKLDINPYGYWTNHQTGFRASFRGDSALADTKSVKFFQNAAS